MSHEHERNAVERRVERLRTLIRRTFGRDGGSPIRLGLETELIGALAEGHLKGLSRGFRTATDMARRATPPPIPAAAIRPRAHTPLSHPPPPPLGDEHKTPVRWVDPTDPRRER